MIENNLVDKIPLFINPTILELPPNPQAADFAITPKSPAWQLGFKALPLNKMGLYNDEFRASWPVETTPLHSQSEKEAETE